MTHMSLLNTNSVANSVITKVNTFNTIFEAGSVLHSLSLTAKVPENSPKRPKRKSDCFSTIHFRVQLDVRFTEAFDRDLGVLSMIFHNSWKVQGGFPPYQLSAELWGPYK